MPRTERKPLRRLGFWEELLADARRHDHCYVGGCRSCWRAVSGNEPYARCETCGGRMVWGPVALSARTGRCQGCQWISLSRARQPDTKCDRCGGSILWERQVIAVTVPAGEGS